MSSCNPSIAFYKPKVLQGVTQIHIMFFCVTICILISTLADRFFLFFFLIITRIPPCECTRVDIKK